MLSLMRTFPTTAHQMRKVWESQSGSKPFATRYSSCWKTTWLTASMQVEDDSASCCWLCHHFSQLLGK